MRKLIVIGLCVMAVQACKENTPAANPVKQEHLARIDSMAAIPQPLQIIDWYDMARRFDSTVYDFKATGEHWPLVWWDSSGRNFPQPVVGLYTAMNDQRQGTHNKGMFHEALASMGAVLGATLVGIDKSDQQGLNYVGMLKNYFNKETGWNIMMNNTVPEVALLGGGYGRDWWYDVYPNMLFYAIYDKYPNEPGFDTLARSIADKFYQADSILDGNYNYSFFNYGTMQPVKNDICEQQDAAAGQAWVLYAAYRHFGDVRYLEGAKRALKALEDQPKNTFYEVFMPFGAYLSARMNAEQGTNFNARKFLEWTFDGTPECRAGWGVLLGNWNGIDISGIVGSTKDRGGYGFLMNTFDLSWPVVPIARYDAAYADAVGKWMLNAANAARFFYTQYMPDEHETIPEQAAAGKGVIGYEGIIHSPSYPEYAHLKAPVAQGDGPLWAKGNPAVSQFSVYGSGHAGFFGSIIRSTNIPAILQLNLLATDFFHDKAYPTYLYYNPYPEAKKVIVSLEGKAVDIYNTVSRTFIAKGVGGTYELSVPASSSAILVMVPAGLKSEIRDGKLVADNVVIDYHPAK
ncbi:hypothetical protein MKQ68_13180 [Chitinophaga horti]|uniref:Linalool dehydratase/isomerase domain-containing protein n=1 Tax=Chitinophaga horti TaxID=2920382 RepID=A0ABY6IUK2_9BACT|nr:hypothetical protein [Chitinophaga horti]UYQ91047.1 hypothetical protein MKQ68_13180 [Chitinophaga horti]